MAIASDLIRAEVIDAEEFPEVAARYSVGPVPKTLVNYSTDFIGAAPEEYVLEKVLEAP
jgi:hypothetical protein